MESLRSLEILWELNTPLVILLTDPHPPLAGCPSCSSPLFSVACRRGGTLAYLCSRSPGHGSITKNKRQGFFIFSSSTLTLASLVRAPLPNDLQGTLLLVTCTSHPTKQRERERERERESTAAARNRQPGNAARRRRPNRTVHA